MKCRLSRPFQFFVTCIVFLLMWTSVGHPANFDRAKGYSYPVSSQPYQPAPYKPKQYVAYRAIGDITVDGCLDETSWANAELTNRFDHILSTRGYTKPFLATRARMVWDDEYLYVGVELEEPNLIGHIVDKNAIVCYDNDIEVFIDVDDDARNYIEIETNVLGTTWDIFYHKEFHRGGLPMGWPKGNYERPYSLPWDLENLRIAVKPYGSINYPLDNDRGWTFEAAIPWSSLEKTNTESPLTRNGEYLRIGFSRVQYPWPRDAWPITDWSARGSCWDWTWTPNLTYDMHVPECWGRVILSSKTVIDYRDGKLESSFPFVQPPESKKKPKIGDMVKIKGGTYTIGPDMTDSEDSPEGSVSVDDFLIDRYEVTIIEYARFLNETGNDEYYMEDMADPEFCGIEKNADGSFTVVPGKEYYPIVYVRPESAEAYASWAGKRLPTQYEWEIAARGMSGRMYPWGNEPPDPARANYNFMVGHTMPVGSYKAGCTPEGVYDLAGNVWELCMGNWDSYPWGQKIEGMPEGRRNIRGGAWTTQTACMASAYRGAMKYSGWAAMIGFRCAKDAD